MSRHLSPVLLLLALVLAAIALQRAHASAGRVHAITARVEQLAAELETPTAGARAAPPASTSELSALEARILALERAAARSPVEEPAVPVAASAPLRRQMDEGVERSSSPAERAELEDLLARVIGADYDLHGSDEELQRFFELARGTGILAEILGELEQRVASHPNDLEARMELASAYVAKIMTMPHGPEQGVWGSRAEEQWREVSKQEPEHWAANFALGNNYSFYPDVMGKTGEAIGYLERARAIQERLAPAPEHVQTYLSLARLYVREGRRSDASAVLEAGLGSHPGNEALQAEIERLR